MHNGVCGSNPVFYNGGTVPRKLVSRSDATVPAVDGCKQIILFA